MQHRCEVIPNRDHCQSEPQGRCQLVSSGLSRELAAPKKTKNKKDDVDEANFGRRMDPLQEEALPGSKGQGLRV